MENMNIMDTDCESCGYKYTEKLRKPVECACGWVCCTKCYCTWMKDPVHALKCMACKMPHDDEFIVMNSYRTFSKTLREVKGEMLFAMEEHYLPHTLKEHHIQTEKDSLLVEISRMLDQGHTEEDIEVAARRELINSLSYDSFMNCVFDQCPGIMSRNTGDILSAILTPSHGSTDNCFSCSTCTKKACSECRMPGGDGHVCDGVVLKDIEHIKNTTKACPRCGVRCVKVEGCSQVICNECKHVFDYNTMKSEDHLNNHTRDGNRMVFTYIKQTTLETTPTMHGDAFDFKGFNGKIDAMKFRFLSDIWFETFDNQYYRVVHDNEKIFSTLVASGSNMFASVKKRVNTTLDRKQLNREHRLKFVQGSISKKEFMDLCLSSEKRFTIEEKRARVMAIGVARYYLLMNEYLEAVEEDQPNLGVSEGIKYVPLLSKANSKFASRMETLHKYTMDKIKETGLQAKDLSFTSI
jgi:hypothetical protein